jgi:hypothetical protein
MSYLYIYLCLKSLHNH